MKFLAGFVLAIFLAWATHYFFPWWGVAVAAGLAGFIAQIRGFKGFLCGFSSIALFWLVFAWWLSSANEGMLLAKMSAVLQMSNTLVWILTLLMGGLLGGFGMLTGGLCRAAILGDQPSRLQYRNKYK